MLEPQAYRSSKAGDVGMTPSPGWRQFIAHRQTGSGGLLFMPHLSKGLGLELVEERVLDFISVDRLGAQFKLFQHVDEFFAIDQFDGWCPISSCFSLGFLGEGAGCDDDAFVCTAGHGASEVANLRWSDRLCTPLALEQHLEGHQWIDLKYSEPVDSSIAALAGNHDLGESGFPKESLCKPLKAGRW